MRGEKTTRAFRTIGEAADELELQPHVLRFWESKFSQIQPMKRGGGRRFYRPEDIEFIRGIKKLLHDEKHPIKDVQRMIRQNGAQQVIELGRSVERASREREVTDVNLVPQRILDTVPDDEPLTTSVPSATPALEVSGVAPGSEVHSPLAKSVSFEPEVDREGLETALDRLKSLREKLSDFRDRSIAPEG